MDWRNEFGSDCIEMIVETMKLDTIILWECTERKGWGLRMESEEDVRKEDKEIIKTDAQEEKNWEMRQFGGHWWPWQEPLQ